MILSSIKPHCLLVLIISIGLIMRVSVLFWGLPVIPDVYCPDLNAACYHADEGDAVAPAVLFPGNYLSDNRFLGYGTVLPYLSGMTMILFKGLFPDSYHYGVIVWAVARVYSILFGVGTILLTYLLALKLFQQKRVSLLSALLVSIAPQHVLSSAIAKPDILMGLLLVLNFLLLYKALERPTRRAFIVFGIATGLLLGTSITSSFFLIIFLLAVLYRKVPRRHLLFYVLSAGGVFVLFHPHIFLHPNTYIDYLLMEKRGFVDRVVSSISILFSRWILHTNTAHGFPIIFFAPLSVLFVRKKQRIFTLLPFFYICIYYLFWRWAITPGYIAIVTPLIVMYAALVLSSLLSHTTRLIRVVGIVFLMGSIVSAGVATGLSLYARWNDPRTAAAEFINSEVSPGTSLGFSEVSTVYGWREHRWRYPRINVSRYKEQSFLEAPEILIVSSFDVEEVGPYLKSPRLNKDFLWDDRFTSEWYAYLPPSADVFRFYNEFIHGNQNGYFLLKEFETGIPRFLLTDPYPDIYIYKRNAQ